MSWFSDIGKVIWRGYRPLLFRDLLPGTYALSLGQLAVLICVATLMRTLAAALLVLLVVPQGSILETKTGNSDPIDAINAWSWIEPASYRMFAQARKDNGADEDGRARSKQRVDFEELLDQQPQRVAAALEGIAPSGEGAPNTYFVGLASYSYQDVFMREIKATRDLFDARFKTQSRSIVLNNNEDTAQTLPIASLSNLKRVLAGLAQKMNVEKDLLVLYLTSHGGKEVLSVNFSGAPLNDIKAQDLAAALDASGIKHRVVIISACHSGSFIPALKNDQTAVLTAAHADKVSFGCSNERD